jgi:tRNA pseudouridine38-40 synthase
MSQRLKLVIAYDGAPFAGWQSQLHRNTVQDHLEKAFKRLTGAEVRVHGAGRTDTGVHALGQCAHVDVDPGRLTPERWLRALNALLPPAIRIMNCRRVSPEFHARFSARGKVYRYRIWRAPVLPPFEYGRAWHLVQPIDFEAVKAAAGIFIGTHDFAAFAVNRGKPEKDSVRTMTSVKARRHGPRLTLEFEGDGFLYKMVRMMVGALVQCAQGKLTRADLAAKLNSKRHGKAALVAPAGGLFLIRVRY